MTTFADLRTAIARDLRDPSAKTFTVDDLKDFVNSGLAEIGRIAPRKFQEDVQPLADALEYVLLFDDFAGAAIPEIEVSRVELWDTTQTPMRPVRLLAPRTSEYTSYSEAGWNLRDGTLELPVWVPVYLAGQETDFLLRVWGYAPYVPVSADADVIPLSNEREWALRSYAKVEALTRLVAERDLYTQWQTRSNNSDVSPAALMNGLNLAMEDWRRRSRALTVLRGR